MKFISNKYFNFEPEINEIIIKIFKNIKNNSNNKLIENIHYYLTEKNIYYFLDYIIQNIRYLIENPNKLLLEKFSKIKFYTQKNNENNLEEENFKLLEKLYLLSNFLYTKI